MTYEDLANKVSMSVMGLGYPVALQYVASAAQEFFEESEVWRDAKINVDLQVNQEYYDINFGENISVVQVREVYVDGALLSQISNEEYIAEISKNNSVTETNPNRCAFYGAGRIRFLPVCGKKAKLTINCSLKPSLKAKTIPVDLLETYGKAIISGALRDIFLMKSKPWGDMNESRLHDRKFVLGIQKARATGDKGNTKNNVMIDLNGLPMG